MRRLDETHELETVVQEGKNGVHEMFARFFIVKKQASKRLEDACQKVVDACRLPEHREGT